MVYEPYLFEIHDLVFNFIFVDLLIVIHFCIQGEVVPFKSYLQRYATPYAACRSSNPLWYAIRRASAHIIVLSSYSPFCKLLSKMISLSYIYLIGITHPLFLFEVGNAIASCHAILGNNQVIRCQVSIMLYITVRWFSFQPKQIMLAD